MKIKTRTLWAPACTADSFKEYYLQAITNRRIGHFSIFILTDESEQDDNCAQIYNKSLLYLVLNAFDAEPRIPIFRDNGIPLLGMEKFIRKDDTVSYPKETAIGFWLRTLTQKDLLGPRKRSITVILMATPQL